MNREDIIRMAREAELFVPQAGIPENGALMRFAVLVAAAEREACAKTCDDYSEFRWSWWKTRADPLDQGAADAADELAQRIRSRK